MCFLFVCFDFYAKQKWRVSYSSFQLLFTDAKMWRKASVLFSAVFPIDFFANLQRFLDVCVIWRRVQICVCRRGNGESCWRNRSRRLCPSYLPWVLGPGEERRPQCGGLSPVLRGQGREGSRPRSAPEVPAVVGAGAGCELPARLGESYFSWPRRFVTSCHRPLSAVWSAWGQWIEKGKNPMT